MYTRVWTQLAVTVILSKKSCVKKAQKKITLTMSNCLLFANMTEQIQKKVPKM